MIRLHEVSIRRQGRHILQDVSATLSAGNVVALIGPNGAGKSTLLKVLAGVLKPDAGSAQIDGQCWQSLPVDQQALYRAVLSQQTPLSFPFTVLELLQTALPGKHHSGGRELCQESLERLGLGEFAQRPLHQLSGGECQRAHMARVLVQLQSSAAWPHQVCLLDEPTSALDLRYQLELMKTARWLAQKGLAVLCVLHDLQLASLWADQLWLLSGGILRAQGQPDEVLTASLVEEVYGIKPLITPHPENQRPMVMTPGYA